MRRNPALGIEDAPEIDEEIRKWYAVVDLKCFSESLIATHDRLRLQSTGIVVFYVLCRAAELEQCRPIGHPAIASLQ